MCRNIKPLFNFDPPATKEDVHNAAVQYVRKVSGFREPSKANKASFDMAVQKITEASLTLLDELVTTVPRHSRAKFEAAARERSIKRFG